VARSLTVLWTALFTKLLLGKSVSVLRLSAVCVVFAGFVVGSKGEKLFDWTGLVSGVVASIFVALYGIYVKRALPAVSNSEWRLLIYNTVLALVLLLPVVALKGELAVLNPSDPAFTSDSRTWIALAISGLMGFIINIAIFMQIKYTSPLTNAISGTVKAAVQTLLGVVLFGNIISLLNFVGIVMVIGGSFWYGQVTYRENQAEKERESGKT
jgi:GDP-fucose transporter C1